jgi:hypothetical protein
MAPMAQVAKAPAKRRYKINYQWVIQKVHSIFLRELIYKWNVRAYLSETSA